MIRSRIKIGDGKVQDTYDAYGLCYLSASNRFYAPAKAMESTSYPEEEGEHILPLAADDAFDYKITFLVEAKGSLDNVNAAISKFNSDLSTQEEAGEARTYKQVSFYNPLKKVKIVGYPTPISEATEFWSDSSGQQSDAAKVEFTIRVDKPSLCNFLKDD